VENESGSKIILENPRKPRYKNIVERHRIWLRTCMSAVGDGLLQSSYWHAS